MSGSGRDHLSGGRAGTNLGIRQPPHRSPSPSTHRPTDRSAKRTRLMSGNYHDQPQGDGAGTNLGIRHISDIQLAPPHRSPSPSACRATTSPLIASLAPRLGANHSSLVPKLGANDSPLAPWLDADASPLAIEPSSKDSLLAPRLGANSGSHSDQRPQRGAGTNLGIGHTSGMPHASPHRSPSPLALTTSPSNTSLAPRLGTNNSSLAPRLGTKDSHLAPWLDADASPLAMELSSKGSSLAPRLGAKSGSHSDQRPQRGAGTNLGIGHTSGIPHASPHRSPSPPAFETSPFNAAPTYDHPGGTPHLAAVSNLLHRLRQPDCPAISHDPDPLELSPAALLQQLIERWRHLVVHVRHDGGDVYVGRPREARGETFREAPWGLPPCSDSNSDRSLRFSNFRSELLRDRARIALLRATLGGKTLGAWDPTSEFCHGHLLAALANCTSEELHRVLPQILSPAEQSARTDELASFSFPLTELSEVRRLLSCRHASPTILLGGEFSGALRDELLNVYGELALSVDLRPPLTPGISYIGRFSDVAPLRRWERAFFWPPCTHQTLSDTLSRDPKMLDGRTFWGIALVIYCLCTDANCVMVEQPDTIIPRFYSKHAQRARPSFFGDRSRKPVNLYLRGTDPLHLPLDHVGVADSGHFYSFADAEERDRWRSSWLRHPALVTAVAWGVRPSSRPNPRLDYRVEIERFAVDWHRRGLPVPVDYANSTGEPLSHEDRLYQLIRGAGDGRRVRGVVPLSLTAEAEQPRCALVPADAHEPHRLLARDVPFTLFVQLTHQAVVLFLVALAAQPLVLAPLDGFTVVGAELAEHYVRDSTVRLATSWISAAATSIRSACFLAGEFDDGPRLVTAPVGETIPESEVVRVPAQRRRLLKAGRALAWCTLAALAGCPVLEPATRAVMAASSFAAPVQLVTDAPFDGWRSFRIGVAAPAFLSSTANLARELCPPCEAVLRLAHSQTEWLRTALLDRADSTPDDAAWADRLRPFDLNEIPSHLLESLEPFSDHALDHLPFEEIPPPITTTWLPRAPAQEPSEHCPMSAWDLMPERTQSRVRAWLTASLLDLAAIRDEGDEAERNRPRPIAVGQSELYPWARNRVWDFTFERSSCGVPLDYTLPIDSHLNLEYLRERLVDYPDQRLASYLLEGVRLEADVELQGVFVPHLMSLPKGFAAVRKELSRLEGKGWYVFTGHLPFWPIYLNGQGSTPRKYEPGRDRRITEGGGPRTPTFDLSGLVALSINAASLIYHVPVHFNTYLASGSQYVRDWLAAKGLPRSLDQLLSDLRLKSKWPKEVKPMLSHAMRNLVVLRRAAAVLGEPLYIFSDDAADYFNQLSMSPEEWWKLGIVFIRDEEVLRSPPDIHVQGAELFIVSERRLGFGTHGASNIAQRFSDALLHMFREDFDAIDEPFLQADRRPSHVAWRQTRAKLASRLGRPAHVEQRLYMCLCYTDDPLIAVVGVERAVRALRAWRKLTQDVGLIMAIPEKRTLGTWGRWLGAVLFTTLGLIIIPKDKLLRAAALVQEALKGRLEWSRYRVLCGTLEHFRQVSCAPASTLSALYEPHREGYEASAEPATLITPSPPMERQLRQQLDLIANSGGAPLTAAVKPWYRPRSGGVTCVITSDAATDSHPAGLAGFCHGLWWYLPVPPELLQYMHISLLELAATGISAIVFEPFLSSFTDILFYSDALATPLVLTRQRPKSIALRHGLSSLLDSAAYRRMAARSRCGQLFGAINAPSDALSRAEFARFHTLCRQLHVQPRQLEVQGEALIFWRQVCAHAELRGVIVRHDLAIARPLPTARLADQPQRTSRSRPIRTSTSLGVENINMDGRPIAQAFLSCPRGVDLKSYGYYDQSHFGPSSPIPPTSMGYRNLRRLVWEGVAFEQYDPRDEVEVERWGRGLTLPGFASCATWAEARSRCADVCFAHGPAITSRLGLPNPPLAALRGEAHLTRQQIFRLMLYVLFRIARVQRLIDLLRARHAQAVRNMTTATVMCNRLYDILVRVYAQQLRASARRAAEGGDPALSAAEIGRNESLRAAIHLQALAQTRRGKEVDRLRNDVIAWEREFKLWESTWIRVRRWIDGGCRTARSAAASSSPPAPPPPPPPSPPCSPPSSPRHSTSIGLHNLNMHGPYMFAVSVALKRALQCPTPVRPRLQPGDPGPPSSMSAALKRALSPSTRAGRSPPEVADATGPLATTLGANGLSLAPTLSLAPMLGANGPSLPSELGAKSSSLAPRLGANSPPSASKPGSKGSSLAPKLGAKKGSRPVAARPPPSAQRVKREARAARLRQAFAGSALASDAHAWANTRLGGRINLDRLGTLLREAADLSDDGVAAGTRKKDELAWEMWESFAAHLEFAPVITAAEATEAPMLITRLLAAFLVFVYPRIRGRGGRQWAKPASAYAYPLSIIRIFERRKVHMPTRKLLFAELQGLVRRYANRYGKLALAPRRRQPMLFSTVRRICELASGTQVGDRVWNPAADRITRTALRILKVNWRTGARLGESVRTSHEITFFTRADVVWRINGIIYADPSLAQLAQLVPGRDCAFLAPPRSKTDVGGIEWSPFPSVLPYRPLDVTNAAAALLSIEHEDPCHGADRERMPLFADAHGQPYTHGVLDGWLHRVLAALYDEATASVHSWHSLRSGLACALAAAGVDDATIQLICRWASPESLKAYRRLGVTRNIELTDRAEQAVVDTLQMPNVPIIDASEGFAMLQREALELRRERSGSGQRAARAPPPAPRPPSPPLPPPPAPAPPLAAGSSVGRRVCVPSHCWPRYPCNELEGRGWAAHVLRERVGEGGPEVFVSFDHAADRSGRAYQPCWLMLSAVAPL